jgi:hypothetical protein
MRAAVGELETSPEPRFRLFADVIRVWIMLVSGEYQRASEEGLIERLRGELEAADDDLLRAWLEFMTFGISWNAMRAEDGRAAALRGADHAERAGQPALAGWLRQWDGAALALGPTPVFDVIRRCDETLATVTNQVERAGVLRRLGRMLACRREFEAARDRYREGVAVVRDAGMLREAAASVQGAAYIELRAGDLDSAESLLREGAEELSALGDTGFYTEVLCMLAEVLIERDQDDEATSLCARAAEVESPSDTGSVSHRLYVEGLLAARRGEHAEGERLAQMGNAMLAESDFYDSTGGARMTLARTLVECGKPKEARALAAEALAIYEAKGDEPAADWARELLASLD